MALALAMASSRDAREALPVDEEAEEKEKEAEDDNTLTLVDALLTRGTVAEMERRTACDLSRCWLSLLSRLENSISVDVEGVNKASGRS